MKKMNIEKMWDFFDKRAPGYDKHRELHITTYPELYITIAERIPFSDKQLQVLDLGCGTGLELKWLFEKLPNSTFTCMDISANMLEVLTQNYSEKKQQITLVQSSYLDAEFGKDTYDYVVSVMSFHHLMYDKKLALYKKIREALKPDGMFIEADYIVAGKDVEIDCLEYFMRVKHETGIENSYDYHIDIPLCKKTQLELYHAAGFREVTEFYNKDDAVGYLCSNT
ncbi:MAG TPA: class I SAM-dependent methyltransferase [Candidatus Cloacimonetes bacterium]|nr:class I SAM-dependent methyltransferase [Candidatus Cloacimonadota bacterium]